MTTAEIAAMAADMAQKLDALTVEDATKVLNVMSALRNPNCAKPEQKPEKAPVYNIPRSGLIA